MSTDHLFDTFAKGKKALTVKGSRCVIYTRVSTKEQADNNMSLETQRKACEQFAEKGGYQIMGHFGGTYESAKTDERKHFNDMLSFVKKCREKVSCIVVYSVDRFSRSGANAIYIAEQLKRQGIVVWAVTQPTDATTASGSLQQNIQFIFSEYDNQLRREKCMAGTKEKLLAGIWCTQPPTGYDSIRQDGKKAILLNKKGKLVAKAFRWKADGMSNEEVRKRLAERGLILPDQRISEMLRNPFYCGLLVHNALEGRVVEGIQEKAVSKELFLEVNGLLAANHQGYSVKSENEDAPLKRFIKCGECGSFLRAYKSTKIQQYYYKCNTPGCKCNKRADVLHEAFRNALHSYTLAVNEDMQYLIKLQMTATYNHLTTDKQEQQGDLAKGLVEINKKIERLEERYILEEIDREMFTRYKEKFAAERTEIERNLTATGRGVSNLEKCLDKALYFASNLAPLWASSDYGEKQKLQFLVFPDGFVYDRKNDQCRTPRINSVFAYMASLARLSDQQKSGNSNQKVEVPAPVEPGGVEPPSKQAPNALSTCLFRH